MNTVNANLNQLGQGRPGDQAAFTQLQQQIPALKKEIAQKEKVWLRPLLNYHGDLFQEKDQNLGNAIKLVGAVTCQVPQTGKGSFSAMFEALKKQETKLHGVSAQAQRKDQSLMISDPGGYTQADLTTLDAAADKLGKAIDACATPGQKRQFHSWPLVGN